MIRTSLARPYRVTAPMVIFIALVPMYIVVPALMPPRVRYMPELAVDRALPLLPSWVLIYAALYVFVILLPVLTVRAEQQLRRTVYAYLLVWTIAYAFFFVVYPTNAPRPAKVIGEGFAVWGLRILYESDPPFNCFPSLHVAHSFVSALSCYRVHRGVGRVATVAATLIAVSTLLTKQHYVLDVLAGAALAGVAHVLFLRSNAREAVAPFDRAAAPALAVCAMGIALFGVFGYWLAYTLSSETTFEFTS
jgi:membrane-associated phospholipid phosphatase